MTQITHYYALESSGYHEIYPTSKFKIDALIAENDVIGVPRYYCEEDGRFWPKPLGTIEIVKTVLV